MKAFQSVAAKLLAAFNAANGTTLTAQQVSFKDIRPVDSITPRPNTTKNTAITMTVSDSSAYPGEITLFYDRVNIAVPSTYAPLGSVLSIEATNQKTIHELLPLINRRLGTDLTKEDVVDRQLQLEKGFDTISVVMTGKSPLFVGAVKVLITRQLSNVTDLVLPVVGETWQVSNANSAAVSGYPLAARYPRGLLTYRFDYTAQANVLRNYAWTPEWSFDRDGPRGQALAAALKAVDGFPWVFTVNPTVKQSGELWGTWIAYNGPINKMPPNVSNDFKHYIDAVGMRGDEFDNVMILQPDVPWSNNHTYRCMNVIHYNDEVVK